MVGGSKSSIHTQQSKSKQSVSSIEKNSLSDIKPPKTYNYREELILYLFNETLPYVVKDWETQDDTFDSVLEDSIGSKKSSKYRTESMLVHPRSTSKMIYDLSPIQSQNQSQSHSRNASEPGTPRKHSHIAIVTERRTSGSFQKKGTSYILPPIEESLKECSLSLSLKPYDWFVDCGNEFAKIKFKNGNYYEGQIFQKRLHGKGIFRWTDGTIYQGEFKNGEITGQGSITYSDLSYYNGHFCNGKLHGTGSFYPIMTTLIYTGEWANGKKHGKGWLFYGPNNYYDGDWFEDRKQGVGYRIYESGDIYSGSWYMGKPHGIGTMRYSNNDFYKGQWKNGLPHGYGEYSWNCYLTKGIDLPLENTYHGSWCYGKRHGYGLICFGMEGSKLVSTFQNNKKDGAGILICGDGTIIESNPLFIDDSPTDHFQYKPKMSSHKSLLCSMSRMQKVSFPDVPHSSQESGKEVERSNTIECVFPYIAPKCQPLNIPVHGNASQINFTYHINKLNHAFYEMVKPVEELTPSTWNTLTNSRMDPHCSVCFSECMVKFEYEDRKLRNTLLLNYSVLENIYKKYSSLTGDDKSIKRVMSRLYLWQFYRDLNIHNSKLSLIDADLLMLDFPDIACESAHAPFEKICFWQFIHSILCVAYECYANFKYFQEHKKKGILAEMLKHFIAQYILPNEGSFQGQFLFKYLNLVPIPAIYRLYKSLGEPHTVQTFLKACCVRSGEYPPRYLSDTVNKCCLNIENGTSYICSGLNFIYIPQSVDVIGGKPKSADAYPIPTDEFYRNLKLFRKLGPRKILECIALVCPMVKSGKAVIRIDYALTFLEFVEILILCAEELIAQAKREEEALLVQPGDVSDVSTNVLKHKKKAGSVKGKSK